MEYLVFLAVQDPSGVRAEMLGARSRRNAADEARLSSSCMSGSQHARDCLRVSVVRVLVDAPRNFDTY